MTDSGKQPAKKHQRVKGVWTLGYSGVRDTEDKAVIAYIWNTAEKKYFVAEIVEMVQTMHTAAGGVQNVLVSVFFCFRFPVLL